MIALVDIGVGALLIATAGFIVYCTVLLVQSRKDKNG